MGKFNNILLFTLVLTLVVSLAVAEEMAMDDNRLKKAVSVSGKVYSPFGNAIAGATVMIAETGQKVKTDSRGIFKFNEVWVANATLRATTSEYEDVSLKVLNLRNPLPELLKINFKEMRTFESTIVITGTREEKLLKDVPVRTEVISSETIEQKGAANLADALDMSTGLRVENDCQNCGFNQLRINGLEGGYSQILFNGINAFSSLAGVYGLEQIPAIVIDRVEVIKGGGSALYGAGAVGGVVNVLTKQPIETTAAFEATLLSTDGEPGGFARGWGSWVSEDSKTSFFVYGNFDKRNEYDRNGDGYTELGRLQSESGGGRFFQRMLNDTAELQVGFEVIHEDRRGGVNLDLQPEETELTEWIESTRKAITVDWNHVLDSKQYYKLQFSRAQLDRDTYYGGGFDANAYGSTENPHTNLAFTYHYDLDQHKLLGGIQYEKDEIDDFHPGYNHRIELDYDVWGLFVQDDFKITEQFSILAGLRADNHSEVSDTIFSPRVSAMFSPAENFRIRANFAKGFKAPVVFDEDLHILVSGGEPSFHVNDPDLKEETATSYSLSAEFTNQTEEYAFRLEANGFYTELEDTFVLDEIELDDSIKLFNRINGGSSKVYGVEFNTELNFSYGLTLQAGFTSQRTSLDEPEPDFGAEELFRTPDNYGFLSAMYSNDSYSLSGSINYTGSMLAPHYAGWIEEDVLEETEDFWVVNSRLEVPLKVNGREISLIANAYNIFDQFQDDFDLGPDRDAGYVYGPRKPRTISIGIKIQL
jgi:outer membrane receptor for ferrienterochelin and colicins